MRAIFHTALVTCNWFVSHCCNSTTSVVTESDHWARHLLVVSCTTGQYHDIALATQGNIQYIALAVALIWDTNVHVYHVYHVQTVGKRMISPNQWHVISLPCMPTDV